MNETKPETPRMAAELKNNPCNCGRPHASGSFTKTLELETQQLQQRVRELEGKLSKVARLIDLAESANQNMTDQEVASSASFEEAIAHCNNELLEDRIRELEAEVERLKKKYHEASLINERKIAESRKFSQTLQSSHTTLRNAAEEVEKQIGIWFFHNGIINTNEFKEAIYNLRNALATTSK